MIMIIRLCVVECIWWRQCDNDLGETRDFVSIIPCEQIVSAKEIVSSQNG